MIQQMIYKGTANGYKTVAFSHGLERTSLINRLEMMCRVPGAVWNEQKDPCPIFARYEVDGGYAYSATEKDIHDQRDRGLTHIIFVPKDECDILSKQMLPLSAFIREDADTNDNRRLPEMDIQQIVKGMNGRLFLNSVKTLFEKEETAAGFFESLYRFVMQTEDKNIRGICVLLPTMERKHSEAAFVVMETITRIFRKPDASMTGYRTMWTGPENNVQYPIFFSSRMYMSSTDALGGLRYILVDSESSQVRLSKNEIIVPGEEIASFTQAIFKEDFETFLLCVRKLEMLIKKELKKQLSEKEEKKRQEERKAKQKAEDKTIEFRKSVKETNEPSGTANKTVPEKLPVVTLPVNAIKKAESEVRNEESRKLASKDDPAETSLNNTIKNSDYESAKAYVDALVKEIEPRFAIKRNESFEDRVSGYVKKNANDDPEIAIKLVDIITHNIRIVSEHTNEKSEDFVRLSKYMHVFAETVIMELLVQNRKRKVCNILVRLKNIRGKRKFHERWYLKWTPYLNAFYGNAEIVHFREHQKNYKMILSDDGADAVKEERGQMHDCVERLIKASYNAQEDSQKQQLYEMALLLFAFSKVLLKEEALRFNTYINESLKNTLTRRYYLSKFKADFLEIVEIKSMD